MTCTATADLPGFAPTRLTRLVREATDRLALDLSGVSVLTEAATGAYAVTPVLAAVAGADVTAVTKSSRYGSAEEVAETTMMLASDLGVADRVSVVTNRTPELFAAADLITNSGHLRPIVGEFADAIRPGCALSLMFETWEIQAGRVDLDLTGIVSRGIRVAGTNERHPHIDVFSYLGAMAVAELTDAGLPTRNARIGLLCDNPFLGYLVTGLQATGAAVCVGVRLENLALADLDAVLVALTPTGESVLSDADLAHIAAVRPDLVVVQYWGDVDREWAAAHCVPVWPPTAPPAGHMAVLPSRVGPDAIVRLQAGGLKVGELLLRPASSISEAERAYIDEL